MGLSFLATVLSIGKSVWIGYLGGQHGTARASRVDRLARWVFPGSGVSAVDTR